MQRLADDLVGDVRAIEVTGVDVGYARSDGFPQNRQRGVMVLWRAENARPGELHGAIAHPVHRVVAERKRTGLGDLSHCRLRS